MGSFETESTLNCPSSTSSKSSERCLSDAAVAYMGLVQHQIQPYFPKFVAAMAAQTPSQREQGRCAVIEFAQSEKQRIVAFTNATELDNYMEISTPTSKAGTPSCRRLFILEDLPYNHILTLGSRLRIPPTFFAGHWDDPCALAFNHRSSFQRCSLPNFRLRYATSNRVEVVRSSPVGDNSIYAFDSRVSRHLVTYSKNGLVYDEAKSHHALSYWSSPPREEGSWDAVLLVDPAPGAHVRCMVTGAMCSLRHDVEESAIPKRFFYPEIDTSHELSGDCPGWAIESSTPSYSSMFDDTIRAFHANNTPVTVTHDPMSVVEIPRKLVVSTTIAYLRRRYSNLVKLQNSSHFYPQAMRHNYLASFSKSSCSSWSSEFFDFIVGSRAAMRVWTREMDENIAALGLDNTDCSAPQWEKDGWHSIKELGCIVEETVNAFASGYLQYVTIQEARVSNSNARSLSRITVSTMLFIPLSTVASIFSMGGDFLPGEPRAWVFWAVAVPVLMILAYLYWYQIIVEACKRSKRQLLPLCEVKQSGQ